MVSPRIGIFKREFLKISFFKFRTFYRCKYSLNCVHTIVYNEMNASVYFFINILLFHYSLFTAHEFTTISSLAFLISKSLLWNRFRHLFFSICLHNNTYRPYTAYTFVVPVYQKHLFKLYIQCLHSAEL